MLHLVCPKFHQSGGTAQEMSSSAVWGRGLGAVWYWQTKSKSPGIRFQNLYRVLRSTPAACLRAEVELLAVNFRSFMTAFLYDFKLYNLAKSRFLKLLLKKSFDLKLDTQDRPSWNSNGKLGSAAVGMKQCSKSNQGNIICFPGQGEYLDLMRVSFPVFIMVIEESSFLNLSSGEAYDYFRPKTSK